MNGGGAAAPDVKHEMPEEEPRAAPAEEVAAEPGEARILPPAAVRKAATMDQERPAQSAVDEYYRSEDAARRLDGLPPLKRSRSSLGEVLRQAAAADSTAVPDDGDQDLLLL